MAQAQRIVSKALLDNAKIQELLSSIQRKVVGTQLTPSEAVDPAYKKSGTHPEIVQMDHSVYQWEDEHGTWHYSDNEAMIGKSLR